MMKITFPDRSSGNYQLIFQKRILYMQNFEEKSITKTNVKFIHEKIEEKYHQEIQYQVYA